MSQNQGNGEGLDPNQERHDHRREDERGKNEDMMRRLDDESQLQADARNAKDEGEEGTYDPFATVGNSERTQRIRKIVGFFAQGLPLVATLLIVAIIVIIIANFVIGGAPKLTWEFISESPRNVNTEGGIFPAIYGTVLLVLVMTIAAVPVGTITAIYLAEYAKKSSFFAKAIKFAVNTLAGVPSIVFGLFGVGFFIQTVGGTVDELRYEAKLEELGDMLESPGAPLAGGTKATIAEVRAYLGEQGDYWADQRRKLGPYPGGATAVVGEEEIGEYLEDRTELHWGKPNVLWAALTLALLTLPVIIVAVEESLRAVPGPVRAASLALGATRWETIRKIVLPNSVSGILTGSILAVGRGAGEVAPILFTGVVYSQTELPGLDDQFMHLGNHLYVLATQSPDVDAAMPLQFATTVVLLTLTLALNMVAIIFRTRLRRKRIE